jgi:hypothetical protein
MRMQEREMMKHNEYSGAQLYRGGIIGVAGDGATICFPRKR